MTTCKMKTIAGLALACTIMLGSAAQGADWPQFLGPDRSAISTETGLARSWPAEGPKVLWKKDLGVGYGMAAIKDGKAYILDRPDAKTDALLCLDLETGEEDWNYTYETTDKRLSHPGSRAVPTLDDKHIYIVSAHGMMHCLSIETHGEVWKKDLFATFNAKLPRWGLVQSPLLYKDMVIVAPQGQDATVVALQRDTGDLVWKSPAITGESTYATPALATIGGVDQILFNIGSGRRTKDGKVVGFSAQDGSLLWTYDGWHCNIPIPHPAFVGNDRVFVFGGYGSGSVMLKINKKGDNFEVEEVFRYEEWRGQIHQPILHADHLYGDNNGKSDQPGLFCMALDGTVKWHSSDIENSPKFDRGGTLMADGLLYTVDKDGYLRMCEVNTKGYKELGSVQLLGGKEIWAPLALSNGRLLVRDQEKMLCLDVRAQ
ncbi:PQQ-binding-like beta-propeller repeat protein [Planctomycetota bacterium]